MVVSLSPTIALGYSLTLGGAELEEVKGLRILEVTIDSKLVFETHLREVVSIAAWVLCAEQESYVIVRVCSRAVSMHMFCPALSIVIPCECRRRSLIWTVLFAVRKGCVTVGFVVWGTEGGPVHCVCSIRLIRVDHTMNVYVLLYFSS